MTGIINKTRFLERTVLYHEKKVQDKTATFLDAGFYLQNPQQLTLEQKLSRLAQRMLLNERCKVNVMTFSMHFDRSDQLSTSDLKRICAVFLKKFGFDKQPYLLYEHHDTLNKHIHVISTLILPDGSRIHDRTMTVALLQKTQRAVETMFGLKNPNTSTAKISQSGQSEAVFLNANKSRLTAIKSAIQTVLQDYKFSTFLEYNALLRQFGVQVSRGRKDSHLFKVAGLVYRTVDLAGRASCKAIKASSLHRGATLSALTLQFDHHKELQSKHRSRLINTVDLAIRAAQGDSLKTLASLLEKQGVKIHMSRDRNETEFKLIYIDNRTKCAFDADVLGQSYHIKGLYKRLAVTQPRALPNAPLNAADSSEHSGWAYAPDFLPAESSRSKFDILLHDLLAPAGGYDPVPFELRKPSKKRKRKSV